MGKKFTDFDRARTQMVRRQLEGRGIADPRVLAAMGELPRERFVPPDWADRAYTDSPLPLGPEQTISQPYIVALMMEAAALSAGDRVLEIGTGSGYQAALLALLGMATYSIELDPTLAARAAETLRRAGFPDVQLRVGDGRAGWPEAAPFAAILVTAAAASVPPALVDQLGEGGRLLIPVGPADEVQSLLQLEKKGKRLREQRLLPVRFVPLRGRENPGIDA
jgi:protein-L-isoaspartate(D-aspartate) O-methyltransferase